jgi:hypothetical protein
LPTVTRRTHRAKQTVDRRFTLNAEVLAHLKAGAALAGETIQDHLHGLLCGVLNLDDLRPYSPGALARGGTRSDDTDAGEDDEARSSR